MIRTTVEIQYQSKVWTHLLIPGFVFIFYYFLPCRIIVKTSKLWNNTYGIMQWPKKCYNFRFLKVSTLCLDDSFAHSWHSLNQLHLECFSKSLKGVPTFAFPALCGPIHPKPSQLGWSQVIVEAGHLMQHSITHLLGQIALTQPGAVFCQCPVEK